MHGQFESRPNHANDEHYATTAQGDSRAHFASSANLEQASAAFYFKQTTTEAREH
jgi:hypothetical protein